MQKSIARSRRVLEDKDSKIQRLEAKLNRAQKNYWHLKRAYQDMVAQTEDRNPCGHRGTIQGLGKDLFPGSVFDAAQTLYCLCAQCHEILGYQY